MIIRTRVISRNLKLEGYRKMLGDENKRKAQIFIKKHEKTFKYRTFGGGVSSLRLGVFTPPRDGVKQITPPY